MTTTTSAAAAAAATTTTTTTTTTRHFSKISDPVPSTLTVKYLIFFPFDLHDA
jgi:hypothetical protein